MSITAATTRSQLQVKKLEALLHARKAAERKRNEATAAADKVLSDLQEAEVDAERQKLVAKAGIPWLWSTHIKPYTNPSHGPKPNPDPELRGMWLAIECCFTVQLLAVD